MATALQDIISCAPFRLPQPRPLTSFEWSVVGQSIVDGFGAAGVLTLPGAPEVHALVGAIRAQTTCPRWTTSMFGPAPAVAPYAYECLGAWFAKLDPASKTRAIADIATKGLLCDPNPPWALCPSSSWLGRSAGDLWEGAAQRGTLFPGAEACAWPRQRTAYVPMTGQELLQLFRLAGGTLPPELQAAEKYGQAFMQRSFLVGIMAKTGPLPAQGANDLLGLARAFTEEIAIVWAPGRGASLTFLLDQPLDGHRVTALLATMLPDLLPELVPGIEGWLPGLLPPADSPFWTDILGTVGQIIPQGSGGLHGSRFAFDYLFERSLGSWISRETQPGTPPTTGVPVLDKPGRELPQQPPPGIETPGGAKGALVTIAAVAIVVGVVGLLVGASRG